MADHVFNVLFLCTGNSARSIIAEAILNRRGRAAVPGLFSAGSHPKGEVHPYALELLRKLNHPTAGAPLQELGRVRRARARRTWISSSPSATTPASEVCPIWPGQPMTAHWGLPDPAAVEGTEAERRARLRRRLPHARATASRSSSTCRSPRSTG